MNKLRNNKGATLSIVLIAMVLVSMMMMIVFGQVNNQIKTNMNREENIELKIEAESQIEYGIAEYLNKISISNNEVEEDKGLDILLNDLVKMYLQQAINIHIHHDKNWNKNPNNPNEYNVDISTEVQEILDNYDNNSVVDNFKLVEEMYNKLNTNANDTLNKRISKEHILKAKSYLEFLQKGSISTSDVDKMIEYHRNEIRNELKLEENVEIVDEETNKKYKVRISNILDNILPKYKQSKENLDECIKVIEGLRTGWKNKFHVNSKDYGENGLGYLDKIKIVKQRILILESELKLPL